MRKYTTGFEEGNSSGSNYYDPSLTFRPFVTGRNGQGIHSTDVASTAWPTPFSYPDLFYSGILPAPEHGTLGTLATGPGAWGFEVFPDVAVITRTYIYLLDYPTFVPRGIMTYGLLGNTDGGVFSPSGNIVALGSNVQILVTPTGDKCGLYLTGVDGGLFQHGSGPITAGEWHCLEVACRWGTTKSYFACRLDGTVISEASCQNAPLWNKFDLSVCTFGFQSGSDTDYLVLVDDVAINDETGTTDKSWPGENTGVFFGGSHPGCLADPAGSGYYDCGLGITPTLPPTCPSSGFMCIL